MLKQKVVAAVDFGTHSSGYAWSIISEQNNDAHRRQIKVCTQWPSQPVASAKNLTALLLDPAQKVVAWGYDAKRQAVTRNEKLTYADGFKMRLIDSEVGTHVATDAMENTEDLIELYLRQLYSLALQDIEKSGYRAEEIRWCLTIPAIWDDFQKQVMWKAAIAAGFPDDEKRLILAIEPEAAAHYARIAGVRTLGATGGRRANLMSPGSRFIVADCGGGTIDITAYRSDPVGKLSEIGRDFGGAHGSEYLNKAFLEKVASKLGGFTTLAQVAKERPAAFVDFLAAWERAKLTITVSHQDDVYISIPAAIYRLLEPDTLTGLAQAQNGIDDQIVLTPTDLTDIFEAVVPDILDLIDKQLTEIKDKLHTSTGELIILVGGFGSSPYLQESLERHFRGRAEVLVPPEPGIAVLYGAAHFAYDPQTRARRSKYTYGCSSLMPYQPNVDPPSKLLTLDDGSRRCNDRFSRFVSAGQAVATDEAVTKLFGPVYENQDCILFEFYRSRKGDPTYTDEPEVSKIGRLEVKYGDLASRPKSEKGVRLTMFFGDTKIRTRAVLDVTGETMEVQLDFDSKLGR